MVATMRSADRAKLIHILGLLSSEHAGERAAAGLAAHKLLASLGLNWDQALVVDDRPTRKQRPVVAYPFADTVAAAEARMRQLRTENDRLRLENRRLRQRLEEGRAKAASDG